MKPYQIFRRKLPSGRILFILIDNRVPQPLSKTGYGFKVITSGVGTDVRFPPVWLLQRQTELNEIARFETVEITDTLMAIA